MNPFPKICIKVFVCLFFCEIYYTTVYHTWSEFTFCKIRQKTSPTAYRNPTVFLYPQDLIIIFSYIGIL